MTVKPYESEADREARRKAEEEKRRREEEAKGSNDKFRALDVSGLLQRRQGRDWGEKDTDIAILEYKAAIQKNDAFNNPRIRAYSSFVTSKCTSGHAPDGRCGNGRSRLCPLDAPRPILTSRRYPT